MVIELGSFGGMQESLESSAFMTIKSAESHITLGLHPTTSYNGNSIATQP